ASLQVWLTSIAAKNTHVCVRTTDHKSFGTSRMRQRSNSQVHCMMIDVNTPSFTLYTTEHTEVLDSDSALADFAAQLTPCSDRETPFIVKGKPLCHPSLSSPSRNVKFKLSFATKHLREHHTLLEESSRSHSGCQRRDVIFGAKRVACSWR
ncbi:hypothetical protein MJO29_008134, partial [Puccinia striiformis f. sp. tritici]